MTRSLLALAFAFVGACGSSTPDPVLELLVPVPTKAVEIQIAVTRTGCTVTYPNGASTPRLEIPIDTPVRLVLTSRDEEHDIAIGSQPIRRTIAPRRYGYVALRAKAVGDRPFTCPTTAPPGSLAVVTYEDFVRDIVALADRAIPTTDAERIALGHELYEKKGCIACHTIDGTPRVGPSWRGIWGSRPTLADGTTRTVDAAYVRASILTPQAFARPGYPPSMPSFEGQLRGFELDAIIAFITSLAVASPP